MGLLDFLPQLDDEKRYALMMAASGLLQGRGNTGQVLGQGLQQGLQGYQGAMALKDRRAEEAQQRQMRDLTMQGMKRQLDQQGQQDRLAQNAFGPNPNLVQNDDEGNPMPQAPGGGGMSEYAQGMARINPEKALALQAQMAELNKRPLMAVKPGESVLDTNTGKPVFSGPGEVHYVDIGNAMLPTDKVTGKPVGAPIPKSMSPDAQASNKVAQAHLGLAQFNADPFGMFGVNKNVPGGAASGPQAAPSGTAAQFDSSKVPQSIRDQAQAMVEGRIAPPSSFALKTPYWQGMLQLAQQADPNFDATLWAARNRAHSDFASGKAAGNVKSLATAANHLGALADAYDSLNNTRSPFANSVVNTLGNAGLSTDIQKKYASVATKSEAVSHELAKVFRDSGMSQTEVANWAKQISPNAAPAQSKETISSALDLMEGRLTPIIQQWQGTMGNAPMPKSLTDAVAAVEKMRSRLEGGAATTRTAPQNPTAPQNLTRNATAIYKAQQAIKSGADPAAVRSRLVEQGYDPGGL